jgi:hypothetical protein
MTDYINIRLEKGTVTELKKRGTKGETYNELINRLLVDATEAK